MRAAAAKQKQGTSRASLRGQRQSNALETDNASEMSALGAHSSSPMSALQKVYQVLVDCLDPDPVLDTLLEMGFQQHTIRDIREERITSDKNRKLIEAVQKSGDKVYCNFKSSLAQCRQEQLFNLLEKTEKGDNTLDLQRELREKARGQMKPTSDLQRRTLHEKTREQMKPTSDLQRRPTREKAREQMKPTSDLQRRTLHEKTREQMKPTSDLQRRTLREKTREQMKPTSDLQRRTLYDKAREQMKPTSELQLRPTREKAREQMKPTSELQLRPTREKAREQMTPDSEDKKLYKDLKEDLMAYYRENESMIPAAPLVDEHKVPIEKLYVLPPMWAYDKPLSFGLGKNTQTGEQWSDAQGKQETSVSQLFLRDSNVRYRKIYITADAGFGKTSLSQTLTMTWCQSHSPLMSLTKKNKGDELAALKYFDFLFLLHLRDYQSEPLCNLDDLIMLLLSNNLSRNTLYTKEFLQRLLHEKTCLIILDGLDEWAHPDKCKRTPAVPHNNHPDSCTVLTTSRPWKLGTIGLSEHNIDRHIKIFQLDRSTRDKLEANAIRILNERNLNRAGKRIADFDKAVKLVEIGDIIYNPYILLQLMCVFFGGLPIGKSKCEIYSNITEFSLVRGLKKPDLPDIQVQTNDNALVPNCMNENETCKRYYILLLKLGKLAFYTLFSENKESSLIFDRRIVNQYMTEQEIEFCLKVGLLCQTKDSSIIAVKRYHVFFQHKSVHEFFSAIYITSEFQNESVKSNILNVCSSLSGILEMSNVFVFVCGINPEVYTCISGELQTIVDIDSSVCRFRTEMLIDRYDDAWKSMESYQSMQLECLQESLRNGNDSCPIPLYFVLDKHGLTYDVKALKSIMQGNESIGKSSQVSLNEKIVAFMLSDDHPFVFMQSLDPGVFTSLETLRVEDCRKEPVWLTESARTLKCLADILTESARTLKCLTLIYFISLSDISITALTGLTCLQSLYLHGVHMTHSNLKCLYAYISQTTTLTQLKLVGIHCSDHSPLYRDCDVTLDLRRLNELKMLHLFCVPCRELHVNPACLEKLEFRPPYEEKMTARASATLWQDLCAAPVLSSLTLLDMTSCQEMIQTIPTLTQLQHLKLAGIDMGDVIPRVSPEMTHLERVELSYVKMLSAAWQKLFLSIGQLPQSITVKLLLITMTSQEWTELLLSVGLLQHPVTVELSSCQGPSEEDWRTIVNVIKTTPTLSLLQDLSIDSVRRASLTLKNKTEYGFADLTLSSGMWNDKSLTQNKEFRTVQANQQQRTERVERYEPEEGAYKIHESAQAKQGPSVEMYEPEKLESECTLMSSDLLNETENQPVCQIGGSFTKLNVYFRSINNQVARHLFSPEMLDAFSSLLKRNTHLECVILNDMKMGDKELEIVKLSKEDIEQISKYEKGKTNIVQLCTETIGRQIFLLNRTQFDLQDFLIELNSNIQHTFADSVILNLVCFNLVKCNIEIKEAYPSMLGTDTLPSLVCILDKNIHLSTFRGFRLKKRIIDDFVNESCKLENSIEKESDEYKRVLKQNFEDINVTHAEHSRNLLSKHSNIEAISVSFVKMSGNGAVQICPCIVIYCKFKSAVPYKEDPFPRTLSHPMKDISFQTDVREGYFSLCPYFAQGSKEWNRELAMGCSIGEINKDNATTIGPFVEVIETHETCFLTVRHLFLPITRRDDQLEGFKVVQPADCDLLPVQHNLMPGRECGKVIASVFNEDIDAALIKVDEERKPARGHFVTVTREELRKAGLSQAHIPTFDNGDMLKAAGLDIVDKASRPLLKIGSRTGLTTGQLCTIDGVVKLTNDPLAFDFGYNGISQSHYFRKQLLLRSFHNQPFCLPGDSGSAVFLLDSDLRLKCIGIVIGIFSDYQAVVTPIEHILDILGRKYGNRTLQLKQFNLNEMEIE